MTEEDPVRRVNTAIKGWWHVYLNYDYPNDKTVQHVRISAARRRNGVLAFRTFYDRKWIAPSWYSIEVKEGKQGMRL